MRPQELNLLIVFDAIMTELSFTRAAERLNTTQPAVSNAVAKMRHLWKDQLFIKDGRQIHPTSRARDLWARVKEPLREIADALEPGEFLPYESRRIFRIAAVESITALAWPELKVNLEQQAPGIAIHTYPYNLVNGERMLNEAEVDLVIGSPIQTRDSISSRDLFEIEYVCVMKRDHALAKGELTLDKFLQAEHLLVSLSGDVTGYTDRELAKRNLKRNIAMTVNGFSNVSKLLQQTNMICVFPSIYAEQELRDSTLVARATPIDVPKTQISMHWHKRAERDQGVKWFGEQIEALLVQLVNQHYQMLNTINVS